MMAGRRWSSVVGRWQTSLANKPLYNLLMRPVFTWNLGRRSLELGKRTLVMGIVNVTPDSFSDGGEHLDPEKAVAHALKLLDEGADVIDIGGESTRPGSRAGAENPAVVADEEMRRVMPVIAEIKKSRPTAAISVDTYKSKVARAAVEAGAEIVNDVSGLQWDAAMAKQWRNSIVDWSRCTRVDVRMNGSPCPRFLTWLSSRKRSFASERKPQ